MTIDRSAGIPLYVQVRDALREELQRLPAGAMIPTESELEARFGVSRITIRKAVDELVGEGLLSRQQGRGTFVQEPKLTHLLNSITSWTQSLEGLGFTPGTSISEIDCIKAPKRIEQFLGLAGADRVFKINRVRLANGEPVSLMVNYIRADLVPGLDEKFRGFESLYECLQAEYGITPAFAEDTVETREATEQEAALLKIEPWSPVLHVTRVAYLEDGVPLEVAVVTSRGDRYQYKVTLYGQAYGRPRAQARTARPAAPARRSRAPAK